MASRMKQWRSSSARRLSSVFGLSAMLEEDDQELGCGSLGPSLAAPLHHQKLKKKNGELNSAVETAAETTSKRGMRRRHGKEHSRAGGVDATAPKVPRLPLKPQSMAEPPLSPRSASSPSALSPTGKPPAYRGYRKFSLPQLEVTSPKDDDDGDDGPRTSVTSPRRLLQSLSASLRALRVYARTSSNDEFGDVESAGDDASMRRCGSHIGSSASDRSKFFGGGSRRGNGGSERRERSARKLSATSPSISPSSLASFIIANSPSSSSLTDSNGSSSPGSSAVRSRSSSSSSSSSSCCSSPRGPSTRKLGRMMNQVSTSEGYQLLTEALGIKIVYHRFKPAAAVDTKPKAAPAAAGDDVGVLAVSAEHLLRKYFAAEQEEKRQQQLKRDHTEGDDISLIALGTGSDEFTFASLLDRITALHPAVDQIAGEQDGLKVFYDDAEGERIPVCDTASLLYVWRDWRHRQQQTRVEVQEEARRERRERWRTKLEQIDQDERGRKKEMLTKIGNMKFMLKSRNPPLQTMPAATEAAKRSEVEEEKEKAQRERSERESRKREQMRGVSLKLHVYEQRPMGRVAEN